MVGSILIVDDEVQLAASCAQVLRRAGFNCLVAYDGPTALALFKTQSPVLVLADINLAQGIGFGLAQDVHTRAPRTSVLLMTASAGVSTSRQAALAGSVGYLCKPFSSAELLATVKALLGLAV